MDDDTPGLHLNSHVSKQILIENCRDAKNPTKPWMDAEFIESQMGIDGVMASRFGFNRDKKGWHYGWASNKHACNAKHTLQAYVVEPSVKDSQGLVVKHVVQSPTFMLFCRRRRRFAMIPSAPIAPPMVKKVRKRDRCEVASTTTTTMTTKNKRIKKSESDARGEAEKKPPTQRKVSGKAKKVKLDVATTQHQIRVARVERMLRLITRHMVKRPTSSPILTTTGSSHSLNLPMSRSRTPDLLSMSSSNEDNSSSNELPSTSEFLSKDLFECIDLFTGAGESLLDEYVFDDDKDEDEVDQSFYGYLPSASSAGATFAAASAESQLDLSHESERVLSDLFQFFLDEPAFTEVVHSFAKRAKPAISSSFSPAMQESATLPLLDEFVQVLSNFLNSFLASQGMSPTKFDELFPPDEQNDDSGGKLVNNALRQIFMSDTDLSLKRESSTPVVASVANMAGYWQLAAASTATSPLSILSDDETFDPLVAELVPSQYRRDQQGVESMREQLGYPWILRKMLRFMEEKFQVSFEGDSLCVNLQRKLFSSGAMKIVLDGSEHDWGMNMPMFEKIAGSWKYRAWVDDRVVHHVHDIGDGNTRIRRAMYVDDMTDRLCIDIALEEYDGENGAWASITNARQEAERVVSGGGG